MFIGIVGIAAVLLLAFALRFLPDQNHIPEDDD